MFHVEFDAAREKDGAVSMFVADALLSKYRIGQRLRPCPNCLNCWPWIKELDGRRHALAPPAHLRRRFESVTLDDICDGSGVMS